MQPRADQDQRAGRLVAQLFVAQVSLVAMVPERELLQQEETQHAQGDGETDALHPLRPGATDGFRQKIQKRRTQQRAHREAHQPRQHHHARTLREQEQQRRHQRAQHRAYQCAWDDPEKRVSVHQGL